MTVEKGSGKESVMILEFSIVPIGKGESISAEVAAVIEEVERSGVEYRLNPMGTVVEGEWDEVMALVKRCHEVVMKSAGTGAGAGRVVTRILIDDRKGADGKRVEGRITGKVASIEERLGREVKK